MTIITMTPTMVLLAITCVVLFATPLAVLAALPLPTGPNPEPEPEPLTEGETDMTEIKSLQREIYEINASKGWHPKPMLDDAGAMIPDRVITKLGLVHTELGEAEIELHYNRLDVWYSEDKPGKPEGYVVELADALIRALDLCEALGVTIDPARTIDICDDRLTVRSMVDAAIEAVRVGRVDRVCDALSALWFECHWLAHDRGLDLEAAIRAKIDYNQTRSFRHGEKLA